MFGLQRRKGDMALGCEYDSHRLDKVNFSLPRVQTRSKETTIATYDLHQILEEISPPLNADVLNEEPNGNNVGQTSTQILLMCQAYKRQSVMRCCGTLHDCQKHQERPVLHFKLLRRRSIQLK